MASRPVVLITGAGRGIGAAAAGLAAARGYDVAVNYKSDEKSAAEVMAAVKAHGGRGLAVRGDMGVETDVERVFATVDGSLGPLTHLVYNCGITGRASRLEDAPSAMMRQVMEVNVLGALWSVQQAIRRMSRKRGGQGGAIVLISSMAATLGGPNEYVWYAASKGGIDSMTVGLSRELVQDGIRVNGVAPGMIATELHAAGGQPDRLERLAPMIPMAAPVSPRRSPRRSCSSCRTPPPTSPAPCCASRADGSACPGKVGTGFPKRTCAKGHSSKARLIEPSR